MGIYDALKDAVQLAQKLGDADLIQRIIELQQETIDLVEENRNLKEEVRDLKQAQDVRERLRFHRDAYWLEDNGSRDGPFCPRCWDQASTLARMQELENGFFHCPECKTNAGR